MYWSKASNPHPWLAGERKGKEREWWVEIEDEEIRQSSWWDLHVGGGAMKRPIFYHASDVRFEALP
jgi:hypothetical protein